MNKVILIGRLVRDPDIRYTQGQNSMAVARYTLAVDRRTKEKEADFISCIAFGKAAEFADKWVHKGTKLAVTGRIQTGSYTDKDGRKVYTTDVVVEEQEFAESKNAASNAPEATRTDDNAAVKGNPRPDVGEGFMDIPDGVDDDALPFN